ncbi:thioredoxin domain-containing protein [Rhodococcus sp. G-MC3]|uniref:DsbA family protein n=1 Tax=Rhodococcus sp. G-MC3 TaxID=3046209 RepID=UPI0024BA90D8|nr:thioredoxin domain-containing protein [Rhodococcus sp. G-MC3]MDJ0392208.1 thioredoxin domain-containing protein [Rhodococcus sp. G-MC3]
MSDSSKKKAQAAAAALQGKKDKQRRTLIQVAVAVVLIALVAVVGFNIASKDSDDTTATPAGTATAPAVTPSSVTADGAIRVGAADAKVVVTVVEDFQCPACKQFESISGETLTDLVADGTIAIDYKPIAILDRMSSTQYSTRAANASICVADSNKDVWPAWHTAMFEQQPAEGGDGLTDDELVAIATAAGADSPEVASCITGGTYIDYVASQTQSVIDGGVTGTPSVSVNGTAVSNPTPDGLRAAITAAQ